MAPGARAPGRKEPPLKNNTMFSTPFSKEYWRQALADYKNLRILVFAALMIALRLVLKPIGIPLAADLRINVGFFVNAYGAMVFGPAVAVLVAAIGSCSRGCGKGSDKGATSAVFSTGGAGTNAAPSQGIVEAND